MTDDIMQVTRRELVLDAQDPETGIFNQHYNESTISMNIRARDVNSTVYVAPGRYVPYTLIAITADFVKEGDQIRDRFGVTYLLTSLNAFFVGELFQYNICMLTKLEIPRWRR